MQEIDKPLDPPEVSRETKPTLPKEGAIEFDINLDKTDDERNLHSNDSGIGSVNNIDDFETGESDDPVGLNVSTNPIPKPERGNFIEIPTTPQTPQDNRGSFSFEQSTSDVDIIKNNINVRTSIDSVQTDASNDSTLTLKADTSDVFVDDIKLDVGSTNEIKTNDINSSFSADDLSESRTDIEEDQGHFEMIHEDVEEEFATPAPDSRTLRINSDVSDVRRELSLDGDWLSKDWSRLDSIAREEQAEIIAAEVSFLFDFFFYCL